MGIKEEAQAAVDKYLTDASTAKGKVYLTSNDRTVAQQMEYLTDPTRDGCYPSQGRFKSEFKLDKLPTRAGLTEEQVKWWEGNIKERAGKNPGYAHVGGHAQDISIKGLTTDEKIALKAVLDKEKLSVLCEKVTETKSEYGVSIEQANVFHVTSGGTSRCAPSKK